MRLATELELPEIDLNDPELRGERGSGDMRALPDSGSWLARAPWPASSPYVTAVGAFNPPYWQSTSGPSSEAVWNESWLPAATSGGPSTIYPRPSWQSGVADRIPGDHRGVPDLAWDAAVNGGVLVYRTFYPARSARGGTSRRDELGVARGRRRRRWPTNSNVRPARRRPAS